MSGLHNLGYRVANIVVYDPRFCINDYQETQSLSRKPKKQWEHASMTTDDLQPANAGPDALIVSRSIIMC